MKIIDAKDLIVGRIATKIAKSALLGEEVTVLNCEQAVITGTKVNIVEKYKRKREMGTPSKGPFFPRTSDRIVKRIIRGMIPHKQSKGREALKRVKCYKGVPKAFEGIETITIDEANVKKLQNFRYEKVEVIARILGADE